MISDIWANLIRNVHL